MAKKVYLPSAFNPSAYEPKGTFKVIDNHLKGIDEQFKDVDTDITTNETNISTITPTAPVTTTAATYTVTTAKTIIFNTSATHTVTLPNATTNSGKILMLKNIAAFAINSASSNVVPINSGTAGTAIIAATAGKWATLQSDGTNWVIISSN